MRAVPCREGPKKEPIQPDAWAENQDAIERAWEVAAAGGQVYQNPGESDNPKHQAALEEARRNEGFTNERDKGRKPDRVVQEYEGGPWLAEDSKTPAGVGTTVNAETIAKNANNSASKHQAGSITSNITLTESDLDEVVKGVQDSLQELANGGNLSPNLREVRIIKGHTIVLAWPP